MSRNAIIITAVAFLGGGLAIAGVLYAVFAWEADYAYLDPAPDAIVWEEGDETTLWMDTNRRHVDMRVERVSLGLGDVRRIFPESGTAITLGRLEGCLDWAVSALEVYSLSDSGSDKRVGFQGTIDRGGTTGSLDVEWRIYKVGEAPPSSPPFQATVSSGSSSFSQEITVSNDGDRVIEASHDSRFPEPYTRRITLDLNDINTATTDSDAEHVRMAQHGGVGVIACAQDDDVGIGLHGQGRELLNHYQVDVHPDPTPVPGPAPRPSAVSRRVCVDSADAQANYLDGGELVGGSFDADDFEFGAWVIQSVKVRDVVEGDGHAFFFEYTLTGGVIQITVNDLGASNIGLDADRVYPVRLEATDNYRLEQNDGPTLPLARTRSIDVGVWLDTTTLSPNDDGRCS